MNARKSLGGVVRSLRLKPLSGRHSPDVATKLSTDELDRISGKRRRDNSTPAPSGCLWRQVGGTYPRPKDSHYVGGLMPFARWRHESWGQVRGNVRGTYSRPKHSNAAVGVHDRATGKVLEGADRQTDRQTFRPL